MRAVVDERVDDKQVTAYYELFVDDTGKWESFTRRTMTGNRDADAPKPVRSGDFGSLRAVEFYKATAGAEKLEMRIDALSRNSFFKRPKDSHFEIKQLHFELSLIVPLRWEHTGERGAYTFDLHFDIGKNDQVTDQDSVLLLNVDSAKTYIESTGQPKFHLDSCRVSALPGRVPEDAPLLITATEPDDRPHELFLDGIAAFGKADYSKLDKDDVEIGKRDVSIFFSLRTDGLVLLNYRRQARLKQDVVLRVLDEKGDPQQLTATDFKAGTVRFDLIQTVDRTVRDSSANNTRWRLSIGSLIQDGARRLLCRYWNTTIANRNRAALRSVQEAADMSTVPHFEPPPPATNSATEALLETELRSLIFRDLTRPEHWGYADHTRTLPADNSTMPVTAVYRQLVTREGTPLRLPFSLEVKGDWEKATTLSAVQLREPAFNFWLVGVKPAEPPKDASRPSTTVRIGAFDLTFNPDQSFAAKPGEPIPPPLKFINCRVVADEIDGRVDYRSGRLRLEVDGTLLLLDLAPGSQDPLPDEFRARQLAAAETLATDPGGLIASTGLVKRPMPIVFRRTRIDPDPAILKVRELLEEEANRGITLEVQRSPRSAAAPAPEHVVVLDTAPFTVAQVSFPRLTGQDLEEDVGGAIANWALSELEGAKWEVAGITKGFTLSMPTQGVGEAMEKGRPYDAIPVGKPVDFRFAPPAKLKLLSSYYAQRFSEAPWNTRRVMGFPGQRAPGAGIKNLRMELLYGMPVFVEARQPLRLTEISARLGALDEVTDPEPVANLEAMLGKEAKDAQQIWDDRRNNWAHTVDAYNTRLAVYEPWAEGRPNATLTLLEGVDYLLRKEADTADPIEPETTVAPGKPPKLRGGATFGFESRNIYLNVRAQPKSNDGLLSGPYLSALGGWGYQRASFDNKRTRIYSDTAMGRTFYYSVERIGRIGVFWNRAKHVIVYRRTVLPSQQFVSDQEPHVGRPLLRKVQEYVEILEERRDYPETGPTALPRGFVRGSEFTQSRIPVDGHWGHDVLDGWTIPLWNPNADPNIYPRPHLNVRLEGDPEGAAKTIIARLARPQQLIFYSSTAKGLDDRTDLWPAYLGVDYLDRASPTPPGGDHIDPGDGDHVRVPRGEQPPGFEALTFDIEPIPGVDLVHARAERPMTVVLRNITMMRASASRQIPDEKIGTQLNELAGLAEEVFRSAKAASMVQTAEQFKKEAATKVDNVVQKLKSGILKHQLAVDPKTWPFSHDKACEAVQEQVGKRFDQVRATIEDAYHQAADGLMREVESKLKNPIPPEQLQSVKDSILLETERAFEAMSLVLSTVETGIGTVKNEAERAYEEASRTISGIGAGYDNLVRPLVNGLEELSKQADNDIAGATRLIDDATQQSGRFLQSARQIALKLANGRLAKWADALLAADKEIQTRLAGIRAELQTGAKLISKHLAAIKQTIEKPGADVERMSRDALEAAWNVFVKADGEISAKLDNVHHDMQALAQTARTEIAKILNEPEQKWRELIDKQLNAADGFARKEVDAFLKQVENVRAVAVANAKNICAKAFKEFGDWSKDLNDVASRFVDGAKARLSELTGDLDNMRREMEQSLGPIADGVTRLEGEIRRGLQQAGRIPSLQDPSSTLRLLRAFGDAPVVPNMTFNLPQVPYFFDDLQTAVRTSPMAALVDRAGDDLKALGLRLPTDQLLDRIVPAGLQNFDIGKLFPDLAGINLEKLFKGFKPPFSGNDNVHVTQGYDKTNHTGWVKVAVDMPLEKSMDVLSIGPLRVKLMSGRFTANTELSAQIGGGVRRSADGQIYGSWELSFGGTPLVTFERTTLAFDNTGKFNFDITPAKVRLAEAMKFLSDLIQSLGDPKSGFTLELIQENGIPTGVRGVLDLPLPAMGGGAFAVSGLRLAALFGLNISTENGKLDFALSVGAALGRKTRPFSLTIAFLSGGGWLEAAATYHPNTGDLEARVTLGIVAGASAEFSFGPAYGGVYIYFGILAEFNHKGRGGGGGLTVGILLLIGGGVTLLGYVTINITLLLQATYNSSDGTMVATGTLSASVRICWCVTINVSTGVTYNLSGGGKPAAKDHYDQFE